MASFIGILSILIGVISILLGYGLNYSAFRYEIAKHLVERTLNQRFAYNKIQFCMFYEDGSMHKFGDVSKQACDGAIKVLKEDLFFEKLFSNFPSVGVGEAYVANYWDVADAYDLGDVLTLISLSSFNRDPDEERKPHMILIKYILNLLSMQKWQDWYERSAFNTIKTEAEDKRTISHHYDIGNEFYSMFLGETMMYSCAIFDADHEVAIDSLSEAQVNKINILINKMNIKKQNARILDIGSGWGFTASHFANVSRKYNVEVTGITLSQEQLKYSQQVYERQAKVTESRRKSLRFLYNDYRNLLDSRHEKYFDGIISIGMLEHVHLQRLDEFFDVSASVLNDEGVLALHYISRNDIYPLNSDISNGYYPLNGEITRRNGCKMVTFVSKYIFPGGCLLASDWVHESAKKHGFIQLHKESYGLHYAKTLNLWRRNFNKNWSNKIKTNQIPKAYDDNLFRIWYFYLASSEAVFRIQYVDLVQQIFVKSKDHDQFRKVTNVNQRIPVVDRASQ